MGDVTPILPLEVATTPKKLSGGYLPWSSKGNVTCEVGAMKSCYWVSALGKWWHLCAW